MGRRSINLKIKSNKKLFGWLLIFSILMFLFSTLGNSTYISKLIKTIDKATDIRLLINGEVVNTYNFDDVIPEFVYGQIVDIKKPWHYLLPNNNKKYNDTNIEIHYLEDNKIVGKAKVFTSDETIDEYIFFMKNVYYKSNNSFNLLLD